jgi:hypothetical protein
MVASFFFLRFNGVANSTGKAYFVVAWREVISPWSPTGQPRYQRTGDLFPIGKFGAHRFLGAINHVIGSSGSAQEFA